MRVRNAVLIGVVGAAALAAMLLSNPAVTQLNPTKIGVIDTERVFVEYQAKIDAEAVIDKAITRLEGDATKISDEIKGLEERLTKQRLFIEDDAKLRQMEAEIAQKKQQLQTLLETGQQALAEKEQELSEPILVKIRETVRNYGMQEGYDLIQEKRLVVLYHRKGMDITEKMIDMLNTEYKSEKATAEAGSDSGSGDE